MSNLIRRYTEAALWFAAAHLLRETEKTRWEQVSAQDVQRWTVGLLGLYSESYAHSQFRGRQQFFRWLAAEDGMPADGIPVRVTRGRRRRPQRTNRPGHAEAWPLDPAHACLVLRQHSRPPSDNARVYYTV